MVLNRYGSWLYHLHNLQGYRMDKLNRFTYTKNPAAVSCRRAGMEVIPMVMFFIVAALFVFGIVGSVYSSYKYSKNDDGSDRYD